MEPIKLQPFFAPRIWGGRALETRFRKELPPGNIGESWEISTHPDGPSRVASGTLAGLTLDEAIARWGAEQVLGVPAADFPLLIKLLDARDVLSVQVHPDDAYALRTEGELGKTEAWVILAAQPGASIVYGVVPGASPETFRVALARGELAGQLRSVPVHPGEVFNIPAGMVHALGRGILVYEVQQNSNAVYRVYDWDRLENGKPRQLHLDKALDVIAWDNCGMDAGAEGLSLPTRGGTARLMVVNRYFTLRQLDVAGEMPLEPGRFHAITVAQGSGAIAWAGGTLPLAGGESVLVPAALSGVSLTGEFRALDAGATDRGLLNTWVGGQQASWSAVPGLQQYMKEEA